MIYYEKGEYDRTLEALDKKLENDPDNLNALTIRGSVRIKTNQLKEAGEDLEKAEKLSREKNNENPDQQRYIRKKIDQLEERKANENKRITTAQNSLSANPNNLEALTELAEANRNLGNYSRAKNLADRILDIQANHPKGIAIKLESAEKTNNQGEVRELARSLQELDTSSQNRIIKERPVIRTILRRPIIQ
jgi:tetratricopeptide (TPR) repeat protein